MREFLMKSMGAVQSQPLLSSVAAIAVSVTSVVGGANALGIDLVPWVSASDLDAVMKKELDRDSAMMDLIKELANTQNAIRKDQAALMLAFWQARLDEADDELKTVPSSKTAKAQKVEAERQIDLIMRRMVVEPKDDEPK
jgi:hypothetical protein